jgi:hypothetical protein
MYSESAFPMLRSMSSAPRARRPFARAPSNSRTTTVTRVAEAVPHRALRVQWKAGGTVTLKWAFGANHLGDCALFLSYVRCVPSIFRSFSYFPHPGGGRVE